MVQISLIYLFVFLWLHDSYAEEKGTTIIIVS